MRRRSRRPLESASPPDADYDGDGFVGAADIDFYGGGVRPSDARRHRRLGRFEIVAILRLGLHRRKRMEDGDTEL